MPVDTTESTIVQKQQLISKAVSGIYQARTKTIDQKSLAKFIATLENETPKYGISKTDLYQLIDLITYPDSTLQTSQINQIEKCLYCRDSIPDRIVIKIIGSLGTPNLSISSKREQKSSNNNNNNNKRISQVLQIKLLNWLICIIPFLENSRILINLYSILFNYLGYEYLRKQISHLLFLNTKPNFIKQWRIEYLKELFLKFPNDKSIISLLLYYNEFKSNEIQLNFKIIYSISKLKNNIFKYPSLEFLNIMKNIRKNYIYNDESINKSNHFERSLKQRKTNDYFTKMIPYNEKTPVCEIYSLKQLIKKVEKLELPAQLGGPFTQVDLLIKLLVLTNDEDILERLNSWILFQLTDKDINDKEKENVLQRVLYLTQYSKTLLLSIEVFLDDYLKEWDGILFEDVIWKLIAFLPPQSWNSFNKRALRPLTELFLIMDVSWQNKFFRWARDLLRNWFEATVDSQLNEWSMIDQEDVKICVTKFSSRISVLALHSFKSSNDDIQLQLSISSFYEYAASLSFDDIGVRILLLPPALVARFLLSGSPIGVTKVCGIIVSTRPFIMESVSKQKYAESISLYNSYIMDICNLIWRGRGFSSKDNSSKGFSLQPEFINSLDNTNITGEQEISNLFGLFHSAAFSRLSSMFLRKMEDDDLSVTLRHKGPVTQESYNENKDKGGLNIPFDQFRTKLLMHLEDIGFVGLSELLHSSMRSLISAREKYFKEQDENSNKRKTIEL